MTCYQTTLLHCIDILGVGTLFYGTVLGMFEWYLTFQRVISLVVYLNSITGVWVLAVSVPKPPSFWSFPTRVSMQAMAGRKAGGGQESQGVEVALAPEELELDPMAMTQKYEEHVREQQAQVEKEDFSDMVAEHAAKQKVRKRWREHGYT